MGILRMARNVELGPLFFDTKDAHQRGCKCLAEVLPCLPHILPETGDVEEASRIERQADT
jgi:hypothetical protein